MIQRCTNPKHPAYAYYGGRGLTVCAEWLGPGGYQAFVAHIGEAPEGHWLDRIDNDKGYEPGNVRWATPKEQAANRRKADRRKPGSLKAKARQAGLPYHVVYQRVALMHWPLETALSTPVAPRGRQARRFRGHRLS
jgi:hypothetical protein